MKRPNITPGPWKAYRFHVAYAPRRGHMHRMTVKVSVDASIAKRDEAKATTKAIAALPDIMQAAEKLMLAIEDSHLLSDERAALNELRAALTKAGYTF